MCIRDSYRGPAANEMMSALASYKLDSRLYANALNRIEMCIRDSSRTAHVYR